MVARAVLSTSIVLLGLAVLGCSGSDSGGDAVETGSLEQFSAWCTGTLKVDIELSEPSGPGGWMSSGKQGVAKAGTTILVGSDWNKWEGYVIREDGTPMQLNADHDKGLVRDTDFTAACATDAKLTDWGTMVLLQDTTFFPAEDLSGTGCVLKAGTELTSYGFYGGNTATVNAAEIEAQCGLAKAYTKDMVYGSLIAK